MDNYNLHKIAILFVKYMPIIFAFGAWLAYLVPKFSIIFGLNMCFIPTLLSVILLYLLAYIFKFCWYHRMFIDYCFLFNAISIIDYIVVLPMALVLLLKYLMLFIFPIMGIFLLLHLFKLI